jgi:hypothetical protein
LRGKTGAFLAQSDAILFLAANRSFFAGEERENSPFTRKTKFYVAEMKPLQKPTHRTQRMVMIQKTICFPFTSQRKAREKRPNAAWKIYESGLFYGKPP